MTAVVFDLDDTLYEEKGPKVAAECAVASGLAGASDLSIADALAVFLRAKRGVLNQRELGPARNERRRWIADALAALGADDGCLAEELEARYWAALLDEVRPYADAVIALPALAERFDLWIATNEHRQHQERKLERLGLAELFTGVIAADEVGHEKPSPSFFAHLADRVGGEPASVVFVGDNPKTDIVGACDAGLRSILLRRGSYARFDLTKIPRCEPTWSIDYLTQIEPLLDDLEGSTS